MKIFVLSLNNNFMHEILRVLQRHHTVRLYTPSSNEQVNLIALGKLCQWADLIFCEFAQPPFGVPIIAHPSKHIVVRIHRVEIYNSDIYSLNWNAVDLAIFSTEHVKKRFYEKLESANRSRGVPVNRPLRAEVVPTNVYDPELFTFAIRRFGKPYRICTVGNIVPKKRQYTLVQMFADLPDYYTLDILGSPILSGYGNIEYRENIKDLIETLALSDRVKLRERIPHERMPEFYQKHDLIVCNSNEEGSAVCIAEAMATGCAPLINCWRGAEALYGEEHIYKTPSQFVEKMQHWASLSKKRKLKLSRKAAKHVKGLAAPLHAERVRMLLEEVVTADKIAAYYDHGLTHAVTQRDNVRIRSLKRFVDKHVPRGSKILEFGCGIGILSEYMATRLRCDVTAVDISPKCIEYAKVHGGRAHYVCGDILKIKLVEDFDVVVCFDFIEHIRLEDYPQLFAKIATANPHLILISIPSPTTPRGGLFPQPIDEIVTPELLRDRLDTIGYRIVHSEGCLEGQYWRMVAEKGGEEAR